MKYLRLFCLVSLTVKSNSSRICSIKRGLRETCNGNKLRYKQVKYAWPSRAEFFLKKVKGSLKVYQLRKYSNHLEMPVPKYFLVFFEVTQTPAQGCSRLR